MAPLKFGLNVKAKPSGIAPNVQSKLTKSVFEMDDEDEDDEGSKPAEQTSSTFEISTFDGDESAGGTAPPSKFAASLDPSAPPKMKKKGAISTGPSLSSNLQSTAIKKTAEELDPTVFDYDAHFATSSSTAAQARQRAAAKAEAETRTPKYVQNMTAAANIRQRDQLRARDKLLQKEREGEGEEFADKEQFVTSAYKEQQEAVRRAEEDERKREEEEAKSAAGKGMQKFWKGVIQEDDKRHREVLHGGDDGAEPVDIQEDKEQDQLAAEMAREMNAKGANIAVNDEGQVTDKRQLLSAGLNVVAKPKSTKDASKAALALPSQLGNHSRPSGRDRQAQRDRQTRMVEHQIEEAQKRAAEEEAEELRKQERAAKSQKTSGEISSARERYLQRKKEAAEAKAKGEAP